MKQLTLILIMFMTALCSSAQDETYRFDFGGQVGMSGYLGDANESSIFKHPGISGGLSFRYRPDARWAFRTVFNALGLSGNTADFDNVLPDNAQYSFKSTVYELGERAEFNFFSFGIGETYKRLRRWSPYLTVGVGIAVATCGGNTAFAFTIPMGAGIKYKLRERITLGLEFTMTKAFSDHLDGDLSDLYQIQSSFIKNTDWYSNISFSISYEFGKRCATCHYLE